MKLSCFFGYSVNVKDVDGASLKDLHLIPAAFGSAMEAGRTALHWAAANGHLSVCEILLDWNCAIDAKDGGGDTPFHLAACHGRTFCATTLAARGSDTRAVNNFGWSAIHHTAWHGHDETFQALVGSLPIRELLELPDKAGHSPLHLAVLRGHVKVVQQILSHGASTSLAGPCGYTPLHYAARQGSYDIFNLLLEHGANQLAVDEDGFTPAELTPQPDFITGELDAESDGLDDGKPGLGYLYQYPHAAFDSLHGGHFAIHPAHALQSAPVFQAVYPQVRG
jgi:ankyrin repeat protein